MSVTYIGPDKGTPRVYKIDSKGIFTGTYGFLFAASANTDTGISVDQDANCPKIGRVHPEISWAWCSGYGIENHEPWAGWRVVAEYTSLREMMENPLDEPAKITWDTDNYQEVAVYDKNDELILNSAGDPFDPPLMKDFSRRTAVIKKNVASVPAWLIEYEDAVNSDEFTLGGLAIPVGVAKCKKTSIGEAQRRNDIQYYELTTTLHFSRNGWVRKVLDAGFRRKWEAAGIVSMESISVTNSNGDEEYPPLPVPLNGSGWQVVNPTPATAVYLEFNINHDLPFSVLPIS